MPGEADVEAAFPDAVKRSSSLAMGGGEFWHVYSTVDSRAEVVDRLDELGIDEGDAEIVVYTDCMRVEASNGA